MQFTEVDMKGNISPLNGPWNFSRHVIQNQMMKSILQPPLLLVALFVDLQGQRYRRSNQKEKSLSSKTTNICTFIRKWPRSCVFTMDEIAGHPIAPIVFIHTYSCSMSLCSCMCTVVGNATVGPFQS